MNVTLKNGKQGTLTIDTKTQKAILEVSGVKHLIAYIRSNSVKIKSDLFLNDSDMAYVKGQMAQFVKQTDNSKKRK